MPERIIFLTTLVVLLTGLAVFLIWDDNSQLETGLKASIAEEIDTTADTNKTSIAPNTPSETSTYLTSSSEPNYYPIRDFNIPLPEINAKAAALYDINTGKFLFQKNIGQHLPIASITKIMTAIIVLEHLNLDETTTIKAEDTNVDGNGADLYKGEEISAENLFKMLLIKSSNDSALALADMLNKKSIDFVLEMNKKALDLGMIDTRFLDPAGLNDEGFSTVSDLIKLVKYSERYDTIWKTTLTESAEVKSTDGLIIHPLTNTNKLLAKIENIIGGKTGFTDGAGESMLLLVRHSGNTLLSIVLGSNDRFGETEKLIEWGKAAHKWDN
ncbi:MAG: hypothetical protein COV29_00300 [Candidatus Yanofskybacteria bacterium CG10_big_fil_rev_8_21_14_0_10_36_16]|uniref:Peptidase S11 D-alanyl-D-alanine carboxypeptidase A N-terminal domain-containing protein n=1 Tax=Candidatus Yanofskybacteria bacterium CG10_big_fil_rev_8_21_14_0_10_36_16 TaxID=1975096 RepID=A0A2J0Q8L8_9BACT|nr:MAG: hypothetical protein COV29_00300 [Candidatus Yanofskybacteria bacterium CG10_big_fil_rev_8_21_14_0_10_36_16]